jgi:predicted AAA+ superfamily ATPase
MSHRTFLPLDIEADLRGLNPHWEGKPGPRLPAFRRWVFARLRRLVSSGLTPATVLRGPRRVGKTVLVRQVLQGLLADGAEPNHVMYVPFDDFESLRGLHDPILTIARWFEEAVLGMTLNEAACGGRPAYVLLDEVQNLGEWAPQVKHLVDNHDVRVLVTGSSSLRIEAGRDSLAGRITTVDLGPLLLREIAGLREQYAGPPFWEENGLDAVVTPEFWRAAAAHAESEREVRGRAFAAFSERGAYPIAHDQADTPWPELADYLNETIVRRAIQHDLRLGERGRKRDAALLEEVFRLACRYAGQTPAHGTFVQGIQQVLAGDVGWERIRSYLQFLDGSLLIRLITPLEIRLKKRKSPDKICLSDHGLRASWLQEVVPLAPEPLARDGHLADLAGHLAESALGYYLASIPNLDVTHFPARATEPEVDFVITIGTRRIPIEVKYRRRVDGHSATEGLRAFLDKGVYNAPFGLLVTQEAGVSVPDPRIVAMPLSSLLWLR